MITSLRLLIPLLIFIFLANAQGAESQPTGGIGLNTSRIIIPPDEKQTMLGVRNTSLTQHFLVQSFTETFSRQKANEFIITPPLFVMKPQDESTLRIINTGVKLPDDRETLYWINVKAIPSTDNEEKGNSLKIAIQNRIRLIIRPEGLVPSVRDAPGMLQFHRSAGELIVRNPTPYFLSLVNLKVGHTTLNSDTIEPFQEMHLPLSSEVKGDVTVQTVDDYGSWTPEIRRTL